MRTPQGSGRRGNIQNDLGNRIVRFPDRTRKTCDECGSHFRPWRHYHRYCSRCYSGDRLYHAIQAYRRAFT
jgi:protein-arginine kinase activator protein McsA